MAKQLRTSRSQLDRLLDPQNVSVTLDTITRAARALGKRLIIRVADAKPAKRGQIEPSRPLAEITSKGLVRFLRDGQDFVYVGPVYVGP